MKKYLDIKGCGVVDLKGHLIGEIEDVIFDIKSNRICSFILSRKGILASPGLIALRDVKSYGNFIVYKGEGYSIKRGVLYRNRKVQTKEYIGKEIIDTKGVVIGNLLDFIFDEKTGYIKALICSRGFFEDIFDGRRLIVADKSTAFLDERIVVENSSIVMINNASFKKFLE